MSRTSRAEIETLVQLLSDATGIELIADHNSTYGGWRLVRRHGRWGGEAFFGDSGRVAAKDMAFAIRMALAAVATKAHEHSWERRTESGRTDEVWLECRCGSWKPLEVRT